MGAVNIELGGVSYTIPTPLKLSVLEKVADDVDAFNAHARALQAAIEAGADLTFAQVIHGVSVSAKVIWVIVNHFNPDVTLESIKDAIGLQDSQGLVRGVQALLSATGLTEVGEGSAPKAGEDSPSETVSGAPLQTSSPPASVAETGIA